MVPPRYRSAQTYFAGATCSASASVFRLSGQAKFLQQRPLGLERLLPRSTTSFRGCQVAGRAPLLLEPHVAPDRRINGLARAHTPIVRRAPAGCVCPPRAVVMLAAHSASNLLESLCSPGGDPKGRGDGHVMRVNASPSGQNPARRSASGPRAGSYRRRNSRACSWIRPSTYS